MNATDIFLQIEKDLSATPLKFRWLAKLTGFPYGFLAKNKVFCSAFSIGRFMFRGLLLS